MVVARVLAVNGGGTRKPMEVIEVIGRDDGSVVLPSEETTEGLFGLAESLQEIPALPRLLVRH